MSLQSKFKVLMLARHKVSLQIKFKVLMFDSVIDREGTCNEQQLPDIWLGNVNSVKGFQVRKH